MSSRSAIIVLCVSLVVFVGVIFAVSVFTPGDTHRIPDDVLGGHSGEGTPVITYVEAVPIDGAGNTVEVSWGATPHREGLSTWALVYTENSEDSFMDSEIYTLSCTQGCDEEESFLSRIEVSSEGVLHARVYIETQEGNVLAQSAPVAIE